MEAGLVINNLYSFIEITVFFCVYLIWIFLVKVTLFLCVKQPNHHSIGNWPHNVTLNNNDSIVVSFESNEPCMMSKKIYMKSYMCILVKCQWISDTRSIVNLLKTKTNFRSPFYWIIHVKLMKTLFFFFLWSVFTWKQKMKSIHWTFDRHS